MTRMYTGKKAGGCSVVAIGDWRHTDQRACNLLLEDAR